MNQEPAHDVQTVERKAAGVSRGSPAVRGHGQGDYPNRISQRPLNSR